MASRLMMLARIGLLAAATTVAGASAASAQGDGRFDRHLSHPNECVVGNCVPGADDLIVRRPNVEAPIVRRPNVQAPVVRRRGGPPPFRQYEYRQNPPRYYYRDHSRPRYYRPRYYDYGPSVYLDFSSPYDDDYYEPPRYTRRAYRRAQMSAAHIEWCYDRYRSYREYDNTYQPYSGPRRQCYSPYS